MLDCSTDDKFNRHLGLLFDFYFKTIFTFQFKFQQNIIINDKVIVNESFKVKFN